MRRRNFISTLIGATAATTLGLLPMPEDPYDAFLRTLRTKIIAILRRDRTTFAGIQIDPIEEIGGEEFRFIRLWVEELERPLAGITDIKFLDVRGGKENQGETH